VNLIHKRVKASKQTIARYNSAISTALSTWADAEDTGDPLLPPSRARFQALLDNAPTSSLRRHLVPAFKMLALCFGWSSSDWHTDDDARALKTAETKARAGVIQVHAARFSQDMFRKAAKRSWEKVQSLLRDVDNSAADTHRDAVIKTARDHCIALLALQCLMRSIDVANCAVEPGAVLKSARRALPTHRPLRLYILNSKHNLSSMSVINLVSEDEDSCSLAAALDLWSSLSAHLAAVPASITRGSTRVQGQYLFSYWNNRTLPVQLPVPRANSIMSAWLNEHMDPVPQDNVSTRQRWTAHSFRQSGTHMLYESGASDTQILDAGRWGSVQAFRPYISQAERALPLSTTDNRSSSSLAVSPFIPTAKRQRRR